MVKSIEVKKWHWVKNKKNRQVVRTMEQDHSGLFVVDKYEVKKGEPPRLLHKDYTMNKSKIGDKLTANEWTKYNIFEPGLDY